MRRALRLMTAATLTVALVSCGSDETSEPATEEQPAENPAPTAAASFPDERWTDQEVVDGAGLREDGGWYYYDAPGGLECEIVVLLTSANDVSLYADAGDLVATNPDQTAGVKIGATEDDRACHSALTDALSTLG